MIWLGERIISVGMFYRRETMALPITVVAGLEICFIISMILISH
jgi:hypothetical protein